ncbi:MAG: (d)CMP kinase [Clostridia bacterium]
MPINIAIDGPAGAGKSTVAKKLAEDYGYIYVDTGAMYRAMALYFLRQGIDSHDEAAIGRACETVSISLEYENGIQQVYLNGENVSSELRTEAVGNMASNTSVYAPVRKKLVELQRELAGRRDVVMDGRDIGTAVLPDATLKVYLTASSRVRAGRRYKELTERGESCSLEAIEQDIIERDYRDMHRELSPLRKRRRRHFTVRLRVDFEEVMEWRSWLRRRRKSRRKTLI